MNEYRPRNVLVTGGAGFIGSNFVLGLLANDPDVRIVNLDLLTYAGSPDNLTPMPAPDRHIFVRGDICDQVLVLDLMRRYEIDTVVHFAAESHVDRSIQGPGEFVRTNVVGTHALLEAARQYWLCERRLSSDGCRFHHVSTDEVFGSLGAGEPLFHEASRYNPSSPYSASKAGADHLASAYGRTFNLPITISTCSNNYGPRQHHEKFIPTVIRCCHMGAPIPVYADGSNRRDWLHVDDHCRGIGLILRNGKVGESYCIGGSDEKPNLEIARHICHILDELRPLNATHERLITFVQDRPGHDWRYAINSTKIRRELGWEPGEELEKGLKKVVQWYLERHEAMERGHETSRKKSGN